MLMMIWNAEKASNGSHYWGTPPEPDWIEGLQGFSPSKAANEEDEWVCKNTVKHRYWTCTLDNSCIKKKLSGVYNILIH